MEDLGGSAHSPRRIAPDATYAGATRRWHQPGTLDALAALVRGLHAQGRTARLVAGGTGPGVYKDWVDHCDEDVVDVTRVDALRTATWDEVRTRVWYTYVQHPSWSSQSGLLLGASTTIQELINHLQTAPASPPVARYRAAMAAHLSRIAGHHVRHMATLGGHLALCVHRRLESDVATVLGAAEATAVLLDLLQAQDDPCPYVRDLLCTAVDRV